MLWYFQHLPRELLITQRYMKNNRIACAGKNLLFVMQHIKKLNVVMYCYMKNMETYRDSMGILKSLPNATIKLFAIHFYVASCMFM